MEREMNLKQQYLIKEIINKGYDPEIFVNFLKNEKENGEDINGWNYGELINLVNIFKYNNPKEEETYNIKLQEIDLSNITNMTKRKNVKEKKFTLFNTDEPIMVNIDSIEVCEGGLFLKGDIIMTFNLLPFNFKLDRNISQLQWFYDTIKKEFPLNYIKNFPNLINYEEEDLLIYKSQIQEYFNNLINNKSLRNSRTLEIFLTSDNKEDYILKENDLNNLLNKKLINLNNFNLNEYDKIKNKEDFFNLVSHNNKYVDISINNHINDYINYNNTKFSNNIKLLNSAKGILTNINDKLDSLNLDFKNLSNIFQDLCNENPIKVNNYIDFKIDIEKDIYQNLKNSFSSYSLNIDKFKENLNGSILSYFDDLIKEFNIMNELINKRNIVFNEQLNYSNLLSKSKDNLLDKDFDSMDINQIYKDLNWKKKDFQDKTLLKKFILKSDTEDFNNYTEILGYYNTLTYNEIQNYNVDYLENMIKNFNKFIETNNININENLAIWVDLKKKFDLINFN